MCGIHFKMQVGDGHSSESVIQYIYKLQSGLLYGGAAFRFGEMPPITVPSDVMFYIFHHRVRFSLSLTEM